MQIAPIGFSVVNPNRKTLGSTSVNFGSGKHQLVPIVTDSFKKETSKKIYSKIQRYLQMIGDNGSFKNAKILNEKHNPKYPESHYLLDSEADVFLSRIHSRP